ncbi:hypothetical protein KI387_029170, partial [Taxus chinensis]
IPFALGSFNFSRPMHTFGPDVPNCLGRKSPVSDESAGLRHLRNFVPDASTVRNKDLDDFSLFLPIRPFRVPRVSTSQLSRRPPGLGLSRFSSSFGPKLGTKNLSSTRT